MFRCMFISTVLNHLPRYNLHLYLLTISTDHLSFPSSDVAIDREVEGDMILADIGNGVPFRPAMFDGAISISAIQWLCYSDCASHKPAKRLSKLFMTLFACLVSG